MYGKIIVIGTGPGNEQYMCPRAVEAIKECDVVVGYKTYIQLIEQFCEGKELISSGMMKEVERCNQVIDIAIEGKNTCMVSSGDAGVYGMAGVILELLYTRELPEVEVEVVPGVTSANASASLLGAPLMNDYAVISLSDLMTPWETITKRLHAASQGDFAIALYNPKSKTRIKQLDEAVEIMLQYKSADTPVGIVKDAMRNNQQVMLATLSTLPKDDIDMVTTLIIGNSQTQIMNGKMVTPRGYKVNE